MKSEQDTIAAISSPSGMGAIGIIRLSGNKVLSIVDKITNLDKNNIEKRKIYNAEISDKNVLIDQVMLCYLKAPKSFTGEDMAEIYCHGNIYILNKVVDLCVSCGARIAEPGEFTKRAFLNSKLDLSQAEAIDDLIRAKGEAASSQAIKTLKGELREKIELIRALLLELKVELDADIEWGDMESLPVQDHQQLQIKVKHLSTMLEKLLDSSYTNNWIREGFRIVISGKANAGKSSLFNNLVGQSRNIVSSVPGTTRDTVESDVLWDGQFIRFFDTAGLGLESDNDIDKQAIAKSNEEIERSDIVIYLIDLNTGLENTDYKIIENLKKQNKKIIFVINKIDLEKNILNKKLNKFGNNFQTIKISCKTEKGIENLKKTLKQTLKTEKQAKTMVNKRQYEAIKNIFYKVNSINNKMQQGLFSDVLSYEVQKTLEIVSEIDGFGANPSIFEEIFSKFCIGK